MNATIAKLKDVIKKEYGKKIVFLKDIDDSMEDHDIPTYTITKRGLLDNNEFIDIEVGGEDDPSLLRNCKVLVLP